VRHTWVVVKLAHRTRIAQGAQDVIYIFFSFFFFSFWNPLDGFGSSACRYTITLLSLADLVWASAGELVSMADGHDLEWVSPSKGESDLGLRSSVARAVEGE
jgi:hypothetical protein